MRNGLKRTGPTLARTNVRSESRTALPARHAGIAIECKSDLKAIAPGHVNEAQPVNSLNPRPLKIIGTHFSARAIRVLACFAPET